VRSGTFRAASLLVACAILICAQARASSLPPAEKILPDDTLFLATISDFNSAWKQFDRTPQARFWNDLAMKSFREDFVSKWKDEVLKPLEHELFVRVEDFLPLVQGQVTFAIVRGSGNSASGATTSDASWVLLVDCKDKSAKLKEQLGKVRSKWAASDFGSRTERIRDVEFSVLALASNAVPQLLRQFLPQQMQIQEIGPDNELKEPKPQKSTVLVGQVDSVLVLASSSSVIGKVMNRISGGQVPPLADSAAFQGNAATRGAPFYAWMNAKAYANLMASSDAPAADASDPMAPPNAGKVLDALGISAVQSIAMTADALDEGMTLRFHVAAPQASRRGLLKMFAGAPKDSSVPAFVPSDAIKFSRWRIDGPQSWAAMEKMLNDLSPQALSGLNFVIDTAAERAKESDAGFDLRKALLANVGDDFISFEKAPRDSSVAQLESPPSLFLIGSPEPVKLAAALKALFVIFPGADSATERDFLGHKIYSLPNPTLPAPFASSSQRFGRVLSYSGAGGYVALSTDAAMVEEFLRSSDGETKSLKALPELGIALQHVMRPGTYMSGFENESESMRVKFEAAKNNPAALTNSTPSSAGTITGALPISGPEKDIKSLMNFSLLPAFDRVSKYFGISVHAVTASVDGLTCEVFQPAPAGLRKTETVSK
jgi:hypothetical protein